MKLIASNINPNTGVMVEIKRDHCRNFAVRKITANRLEIKVFKADQIREATQYFNAIVRGEKV